MVNEARSDNSPLHSSFEWNDTVAGEKFRLWQAREIVGSVMVEIKGRDREAFQSVVVTVSGVKTRGYVSTETIIKSADLKGQLKAAAVREIRHWQDKYKGLEELEGVVNEEKLDEVSKEV